MRRSRSRLSRKQKRIKNRVTFRTLFLLAITLIFNTYAWFLYVTTVEGTLKAHVDAWHVQFEVDNVAVQNEFTFEIQHAYPGMTNQTKTVSITNTGEKVADITYSIKSARIFDDVYVSSEAIAAGTIVAPTGATVISEAALLSKLTNDFPFHINFSVADSTIDVNESSSMTITFSWAFGTGVAAEDAEDTEYGELAYDWNESGTTDPAIEVKMNVGAEQHRDP